MWSEIKIAVSGKSGCGNTTVSRLLAETLKLRLINYTFHDMARERNIPFERFCQMVEEDPVHDIMLDNKLLRLAEEPGCVLGSRLAIWILKDADLRVYLEASAEVRARRIANREESEYQQTLEKMNLRDSRDRNRYIKLYQIDINDYGFADLIIDTEKKTPDEIVKMITGRIKKRG